jgi:RNA polymerase sigma-70 factor (ECF subfamily)
MPPWPQVLTGRDAVLAALTGSWDPASPEWVGRFRAVPTRANGRPALAGWTTRDGTRYDAFAIGVLEIEDDRVVAMTAFHEPHLFTAFGLPMSFRAGDRLPGDHD